MKPLSPEFWYEALASEVGIVLRTDDPHLCKQKLYAMRKQLQDPDLDLISILTSPEAPDTDLWLVKRRLE